VLATTPQVSEQLGKRGSVRTENAKVRKTFNVTQNQQQTHATAPISSRKAARHSRNICRCCASGMVSLWWILALREKRDMEAAQQLFKQRYYHMHGFGCIDSAARFCSAFDESRNYLRPRSTMGETASPDISGDKSSLIGLLLMTGSDASSLLARENGISAVAHFLGELYVLHSDTARQEVL
jgi:hypothetical protein